MILPLVASSPTISFARDVGIAGFNIQRFSPQLDGYGIYNVSSSKVLPHLKYNLGIYADFSHNLASLVMPARNVTLKAVDSTVWLDVYAALGVINFLEAGLLLPTAAFQNGYNFNDLQKYTTSTLGDIRFDVKARAIKDAPKRVGLAFLSRTTFPTGKNTAFTGYDGLSWEGQMIIDKKFKPIALFANVGYRFLKSTRILSTDFDDVLTYGTGVIVPLPLQNRSWALLAELTGETVTKDLSEVSSPLEARGGIRKQFGSGIALDVGAGAGITKAFGSPSYRVLSGISFNSANRSDSIKARSAAAAPESFKYTIHFAFDRYAVDLSQSSELDAIAAKLVSDGRSHAAIEGHTDDIGASKYNMKLSCKRAESVKARFVSAGVSAERLEVACFGETRPVGSNITREGRQKNRRVEIESKATP